MEQLDLIVIGVATGSLYSLLGLGLATSYRATGVVNFAQGAVTVFAALAYIRLSDSMPTVVAIAGTLAVAAAVNTLIGLYLHHWIRLGEVGIGMIMTIAISFLLQGLGERVFGIESQSAPDPLGIHTQNIGSLVLPGRSLSSMIYLVVLAAALALWLNRSVSGRAFRAPLESQTGATVIGIPIRVTTVGSFTLAGIIAGFGALSLVSLGSVRAEGGSTVLVAGLIAAVIGGISTPMGSVVGGLVVGIVGAFATSVLASITGYAVELLVLIVVMSLRPNGVLNIKARHV